MIKDYFKRQIQLWGEDKQNLLQRKKIAIIGSGGLGSSLAFALGSTGIKEIHMVDFDDVSVHNIHRQITFKLGDEGKNKALLNAKMIQERSPFVDAKAHQCDFITWSKKGINVDLILDATDNLQTRSEIDEYSKETKTPWVYGSVEAFNAQVCLFYESSFNDLFKINDRTPSGIAAPMVMHTASLQANLAIRYLTEMNTKKDTLYYIYFDNEGEMITQKFKLPKRS